MISINIEARTWSKNSFGLFNYHTKDQMVGSFFTVFNDTKLLRHEQTVEISNVEKLLHKPNSKHKKIIVYLTAKDSDM